jgi:hypothetical protein
MTLHDPFAGPRRKTSPHSFIHSFIQKLLCGTSGGSRRPGTDPASLSSPDRGRERRRLAALDRRLAADAPHLAAMLDIFNQLSAGEAIGSEELPEPPRQPAPARRARPRPLHIAVLVSLAVAAALCYALSAQLHAAVRPCLAPGASAPASAEPTPARGVPATSWQASAAPELSGSVALPGEAPVLTVSCSAYSARK